MKKAKIREWIRKFHSIFLGEDGFTLIEAIATIAIVGIVVTPIAMVFQGSLEASLDTRRQLKANQLGQEYTETIESMTYEELKRLVDDYGGVISGTTIANGGFDIPQPIDGFDVTVDLHYAKTRSDGSTDAEYNTSFDDLNYVLDPTITDAPFVAYNMFLHLKSAVNSGVDLYDKSQPYDGVSAPKDVFTPVSSDRNIDIVYSYVDEHKTTTRLDVTQDSKTVSYNFATGTEDNNILVYCDDILSTTGLIQTNIDIRSYVEEASTLYIYESLSDKIKPNVSVGLGKVNVIRGLAVVDTSVNTHRIYEIEVTIKDSNTGKALTHIITTRLAK